MKTRLCCLFAILTASGAVFALAGPYSIEDGILVEMGPGYLTTFPIGGDLQDVFAIEFSEDGFIYGVNAEANTLVRIDPATGVPETVGSLGVDVDVTVDLDEDSTGQLRMLTGIVGGIPNGLFAVDRVSGAATLVCEPDYPWIFGLTSYDGGLWTSTDYPDPPDPGCGLKYIDHDGFMGLSLETASDGWIHTINSTCNGWTCSNWFSRINPSTSAVEHLGNYINETGVFGLTFEPSQLQPPAAIPALDRHGIVLLIVLLAAAGGAILRRTT